MSYKKEAVFIVLVNYNGYKNTKKCLDSVFRCNYDNYKVCVVDNASTDGSFVQLEQIYKDNICLIGSDSNIGFGGVVT